MKNYDAFAPHYDLAMGERSYVAFSVNDLIRKHCPKARTLLELGCGSGTMLKILKRYYLVTGIDRSAPMIKLAKKKVPQARLLVDDITTFNLNERFDVVICVFDTMNHVVSFASWKKVFLRARRHLNPGGVFIFDINTEFKLERFCTEPTTAEIEEDSVSLVDVVKMGVLRYRVDVRVFRRERGDRYRLHLMHIPEVTYPTPRIVEELSRHFEKVMAIDLERKRVSEETEELYFVCKGAKR